MKDLCIRLNQNYARNYALNKSETVENDKIMRH